MGLDQACNLFYESKLIKVTDIIGHNTMQTIYKKQIPQNIQKQLKEKKRRIFTKKKNTRNNL